MGIVRVKFGVHFNRIDPAGFRILGSLDRVARSLPFDLTLTCGTDAHDASDPHSLGRAYDIRTHDLSEPQKQQVILATLRDLQESADDTPEATSGGWATKRFFGWLEQPGELTEHAHFQQRKGVSFP